MRHDAQHATFTKNNAAQSFRNYVNGLNAHFLVQFFVHIEYHISGFMLSTTIINH